MYCTECGYCETGVREDCPICGRDVGPAKDGSRNGGHWLFLILMIPLVAFYFMRPSFRASPSNGIVAGNRAGTSGNAKLSSSSDDPGVVRPEAAHVSH